MKQEIKKLVGHYHKKIGSETLLELNKMVLIYLEKIIKNASRNADFSGRVIIRKEDLKTEVVI